MYLLITYNGENRKDLATDEAEFVNRFTHKLEQYADEFHNQVQGIMKITCVGDMEVISGVVTFIGVPNNDRLTIYGALTESGFKHFIPFDPLVLG